MYNLSLLPKQYAINSVASLSDEFQQEHVDFKSSLTHLKSTLVDSGFMLEQDHRQWFSHHGIDYLHNPKLFALAPLNYICIFLSELFKLYDIEDIYKKVSRMTLKSALIRLTIFKGDENS